MFLQPRIMARAGVMARAKMPIPRELNKQIYRSLSKFVEAVLDDDDEQESFRGSLKVDKTINTKMSSVNWVPHPPSGIYVPQGHERVIDDVPNGSACFSHQTFWLISHDNLDKPDPNEDSTF